MKTVLVEWYLDGEKIDSASLVEHTCGADTCGATAECENCDATSADEPILLGVSEEGSHHITCHRCLRRSGDEVRIRISNSNNN